MAGREQAKQWGVGPSTQAGVEAMEEEEDEEDGEDAAVRTQAATACNAGCNRMYPRLQS